MNKDDKKSIYEIYRACRLCGAGAGYKMPIIQNVIDVDDDELELKDKIKDCVQIEVSQDDRMPPLICEVCVDKVNDFHYFMKMCQQTNKWTRLRLGLPLQIATRSISQTEPSDQSNCILGVTEPVYVNSDSEGEPLAKQKTVKIKPGPKSVKAREEAKAKAETQPQRRPAMKTISSRESTPEQRIKIRRKRSDSASRSVSPKRTTRQRISDDFVFEQLQDELDLLKLRHPPKMTKKEKKLEKQKHRSEKGKEKEKPKQQIEVHDSSFLSIPKAKRLRDSTTDLTPPPTKKTRMNDDAKLEETPNQKKKLWYCPICNKAFGNAGALGKHKHNIHPPEPVETERPKIKPGPKSKTKPTQQSQSKPEEKAESKKPEPPKPDEPTPTKPAKKVDKDRKQTKEKSKDEKKEGATKIVKEEPKIIKEDKKVTEKKVVKKKEESKNTASPRAKLISCIVCNMSMKTYQGLAAHNLKIHMPMFTPKKKACNACETWFSTKEEATTHHNRHLEEKLPYTCNKCYDDFADLNLYELHFINNQCLSTYEVPDVKCDACWRTYPTYKLLEDHKCPGEAGRPGGKCSKCNKTYSLLKNQIIHEMKCKGRKRESDEPTDPDISSRMLPMEVRLIRFDTLLKKRIDDTYDVSRISHTFGLDMNHTYPYFYSKNTYGLKNEPFDAMVSIKDEIKEEVLAENFVNWDSDDSGNDEFLSNSKSIEKLSTLALKTLFSMKCLGKVPKKLKSFDKHFGSIMSINFSDDIRRNIDSIINNLAKETHSDSFGSDSILAKTQENGDKTTLDFKSYKPDLSDFCKKMNVTNLENTEQSNKVMVESNETDNEANENNLKEKSDLCHVNEESDFREINNLDTDDDTHKTNTENANDRQNSLQDKSHENNATANVSPKPLEKLQQDIVLEPDITKTEDNDINTRESSKIVQPDDKNTYALTNGDNTIIDASRTSHVKEKVPEEMEVDSREEIGNLSNIESSNDGKNNNQSENQFRDNSECGKSDHYAKSDLMEVNDSKQNIDQLEESGHKEKSDREDNPTERSESNGDSLSLNSFKSIIGSETDIPSDKLSTLDCNEETKRLIDELDAQIARNDNVTDKQSDKKFEKDTKNVQNKDDLKSLQLETVSDEEFNFDI